MERLNNEMRQNLSTLRFILKEACHADGCTTVTICPRQCGCRNRRTFKLNTETSICWELGDRIYDLLRFDYDPTRRELNDLIEAARSYYHLSRFHMTRGWKRFFNDVEQCIEALCEPTPHYFVYMRADEFLRKLKGNLKRLKREPK
jgi:hypothetical protein